MVERPNLPPNRDSNSPSQKPSQRSAPPPLPSKKPRPAPPKRKASAQTVSRAPDPNPAFMATIAIAIVIPIMICIGIAAWLLIAKTQSRPNPIESTGTLPPIRPTETLPPIEPIDGDNPYSPNQINRKIPVADESPVPLEAVIESDSETDRIADAEDSKDVRTDDTDHTEEEEQESVAAKIEQRAENSELDELSQIIADAAQQMKNAGRPFGSNSKPFKAAVSMLRQASSRFKDEIRPDFYLGLVFSGVGVNDPKSAEIHFKRVVDRKPGQVSALNNLALTHIKFRKIAPARNYFSQAVDGKMRPHQVDHNLSRLMKEAENYQIKKEEFAKINGLIKSPSGGNSCWHYMPLDTSPKMLEEFKPFTQNGNLEDTSCVGCNGAGSLRCPACGGRGKINSTGTQMVTINTANGPQSVSVAASSDSTCSNCSGQGRIDCHRCGRGR